MKRNEWRIFRALIWEQWRRTWPALGFVLGLMTLFYLPRLSEAAAIAQRRTPHDGELIAAALTSIVGLLLLVMAPIHVCLTFSRGSREGGYPEWLYAMPVSAGMIAATNLVNAAASVLAVFATFASLWWPIYHAIPNAWPIVPMAVCLLACGQALGFSAFWMREERALVALVALVPACLLYFGYTNTTFRALPAEIPIAIVPIMIGAAYAVSAAGITIDRSGKGSFGAMLRGLLWVVHSLRGVREEPFRSPEEAHRWLQSGGGSNAIPLLGGMIVLAALAEFSRWIALSNIEGEFAAAIISTSWGAFFVLAMAVGKRSAGLGLNKGEGSASIDFLYALPITTERLAAIQLMDNLKGSLGINLVIGVVLAMGASLAGAPSGIIIIFAIGFAVGWPVESILLVALVTGTSFAFIGQVVAFRLLASANPRLRRILVAAPFSPIVFFAVYAVLAVGVGADAASEVMRRIAMALVWTATIAAPLVSIAVIAGALRRRLLAPTTLRVALCWWGSFMLLALLWWNKMLPVGADAGPDQALEFIGLTRTIGVFLGAALFLPLFPLGAIPLALHWNRHR